MEENWRPIPGRDGYEASNLGRIRSVDRVIAKRSRSGRIVYAKLKGRVLRLNKAGSDYLFVSFRRGRSYVHHLILEAFVGPRPAGRQAAHGDGNPLNNAVANLRWAARKENAADKVRHGTAVLGTRSPNGRKAHCPRVRRAKHLSSQRQALLSNLPARSDAPLTGHAAVAVQDTDRVKAERGAAADVSGDVGGPRR
jgi:hypothetical protein